MRNLLALQYPFLFVDESQDTMESVVVALKIVNEEQSSRFCLGFFGDPMQRIYLTGIGTIAVGPGWAQITKPENFRCPAAVLSVANAIRRDGDGLVQSRGRMTGPENALVRVLGNAEMFILPIDERREQRIEQVRAWAASKTNDSVWQTDQGNEAVKVLVIVHRMAAKRLGFSDLYAALNDRAPEKFKNGFLDGTAWPLRPFISFVLPLVSALREGREFDAIQLLRSQSPLLASKNLKGVNIAERLCDLRRVADNLMQMMEPGAGATNADVLRCVHESKVIALDPRVLSYLDLPSPVEVAGGENAEAVEGRDDEEEDRKSVV
jgi:DNA helicase II / ATP-dependent DNA helicase PcrA